MVLLVVWIPFPRHRARPAAGPRGQQALRVGRFLGNLGLLIWLRQLCHQQDCTCSRRGYCGAPPGCAGRLSLSGSRLSETTTEAEREKSAKKFGNKLFMLALIIPFVAAIFAVAGMRNVSFDGSPLLETGMATIIGLGAASVIALVTAMIMFKVRSPVVAFKEGDRLLGHIGWAAILPQFLATLGTLFNNAGVGDAVGRITSWILPSESLFAAVCVYCLGMALFTLIMGNAFAAFPVMTAAVGWPLLIQHFHGNMAAVFAMGMLAGFCGTLCTPMAANFNLVPAALLELDDSYGPIKAQIPTAVPLLVCTILIMYLCCFPGGLL